MSRWILFCSWLISTNVFAQSSLPTDPTPPIAQPGTASPTSPIAEPGLVEPSNPQAPPVLEPPAPFENPPTVVEAPKELNTKTLRALSKASLYGHLSPLSSWLPMKYGISLAYIQSENWTWEFEHTRRSISASLFGVDFGEVVDQRTGVQARWYPGANSFHFLMGVFKSEFSFELGNTVVNNITGTVPTTALKFEAIGPQLGLGNRWQWQNGISFGVDWFVMYIPLFAKTAEDRALDFITNSDDKEDVNDAIRIVQNVPQFDLLRIMLGYTF